MKFLTYTALLAVVKADDTCTSGTADCECDDTDANNCLKVDADCVFGEHSACDEGTSKIVASAPVIVGACTSGADNCECDDTDANNCLTVGTACDDTHSACGDDNTIVASVADEPETCDDCDADNC